MCDIQSYTKPNILQFKLTRTFAPKPRTTSRILPMRLKASQDSDIALEIPSTLALSPKTPSSSAQSQ